MPYTLHGAVASTCTRRVLTSALQIGADIKVDEVEFTKIYTPEWTAHQPFNQMPYLSDDSTGFETFESRAMAKYIALKEKSDLIPSTNDIDAYAKFEQACSIEQSNFDPFASGLAAELVFGPARGAPTDQKRVETLTATLAKKLQGYERILEKQRYLAGDKLTLADIFHLPYGKMAVDLGRAPGLVDGSLPNVTRWWKEITALPAWEKANNWAK
ncbi:Glutathione S-transferase [Vanrija pseudolonga]|uniref:glutathione transferase n=1 Tax=Vanrija pseudolonga TaxID=143232 RepID=A0AAF0YGU1_9TREE|nr:Glutathione S-transferase [Vanrija pseudolonga]